MDIWLYNLKVYVMTTVSMLVEYCHYKLNISRMWFCFMKMCF